MNDRLHILPGFAQEQVKSLPDNFFHTVVTSPPYYGLRNYGIQPSFWGGDPDCAHEFEETVLPAKNGSTSMVGCTKNVHSATRKVSKSAVCCKCGGWLGCLGLEPHPNLYVEHLVSIFDEVWRVLRKDGSVWLNLGDSYATGAGRIGKHAGGGHQGDRWAHCGPDQQPNRMPLKGIPKKSLIGIPWRVALALHERGWIIRNDIIWAKPAPLPESVKDRCTRAHEYIFHLTKSSRYFYDCAAIAEKAVGGPPGNVDHGKYGLDIEGQFRTKSGLSGYAKRSRDSFKRESGKQLHVLVPGHTNASHRPDRKDTFSTGTRNKRTVWEISTSPYKGAHFATFPREIPRTCILATTPPHGRVLDLFAGSGTTLEQAIELGHEAWGIEANPQYCEMIRARCSRVTPALDIWEAKHA